MRHRVKQRDIETHRNWRQRHKDRDLEREIHRKRHRDRDIKRNTKTETHRKRDRLTERHRKRQGGTLPLNKSSFTFTLEQGQQFCFRKMNFECFHPPSILYWVVRPSSLSGGPLDSMAQSHRFLQGPLGLHPPTGSHSH